MPDKNNMNSSDDEEIDKHAHKKLLDAVGRLNKNQFIKKPTRNEPILKKSEFHLVKTKPIRKDKAVIKESSVLVPDLVNVLKKTKKHEKISKELKNVERKSKTLSKPLERPVLEQIRRTIGYDRAKKKLNRWTAVIAQNQASDTLAFPLVKIGNDLEIFDKKKLDNTNAKYRIKTDLMKTIEELDEKYKPTEEEKDDTDDDHKIKLSREELIAKNRELRLIRLKESQKSAKARIQNKIKSKKFHKLMKKEKIKNQMKEFEVLQKDDPELALQKLEKLEKSRVLERALLRHKNTGTWAKNLQIRAKYDTTVRKELADQLAISRELTQKQRDATDDLSDNDNDDSCEQNIDEINGDVHNPWMAPTIHDNSNQDDEENDGGGVLGYRKYWNDKNNAEKAIKKYNMNKESKCTIETISKTKKPKVKSNITTVINGWTVEDNNLNDSSTSKCLTSTQIADNLDDLFDNAEEILQHKIQTKLKSLNEKATANNQLPAKEEMSKKNKKSTHNDLSFKQQIKRPQIDEQLTTTINDEESNENDLLENLKKNSNSKLSKTNETSNINPDKFITVKRRHLQTALPDMDGIAGFDVDDDDDNNGMSLEQAKRLTIAEAFEDDDIVADFKQDQFDENAKNKRAQEIDLTLPGWGSWAGCGINHKKKTNKLILKFPNEEKRRDENKGNVIIADELNQKLRAHQVSDLPFPFTSIKNFEASIRAPIGKDFIPATAHQLLTRPAVSTKMGAVIEPMNEESLVKEIPFKPKVIRKMK